MITVYEIKQRLDVLSGRINILTAKMIENNAREELTADDTSGLHFEGYVPSVHNESFDMKYTLWVKNFAFNMRFNGRTMQEVIEKTEEGLLRYIKSESFQRKLYNDIEEIIVIEDIIPKKRKKRLKKEETLDGKHHVDITTEATSKLVHFE